MPSINNIRIIFLYKYLRKFFILNVSNVRYGHDGPRVDGQLFVINVMLVSEVYHYSMSTYETGLPHTGPSGLGACKFLDIHGRRGHISGTEKFLMIFVPAQMIVTFIFVCRRWENDPLILSCVHQIYHCARIIVL